MFVERCCYARRLLQIVETIFFVCRDYDACFCLVSLTLYGESIAVKNNNFLELWCASIFSVHWYPGHTRQTQDETIYCSCFLSCGSIFDVARDKSDGDFQNRRWPAYMFSSQIIIRILLAIIFYYYIFSYFTWKFHLF